LTDRPTGDYVSLAMPRDPGFRRPRAPTVHVRRGAVRVRADVAERLRAGHPWVYREAVERAPVGELGAEIEVRDSRGGFVARGLYDPASPLAIRIFTTDPDRRIDASLIEDRIASAARLRSRFVDLPADARRVLNAEGDGVPGATCDRFGDFLVVHLFTPSIEKLEGPLLDALEAHHGPRGIYLQRRYQSMGPGRPRPGAEHVRGEVAPLEVEVRENDLVFIVDVTAPLAPGLFLDMREGRRLVRARAAGLRVINCFSYTGALSLAAACGGAQRVTSLDLLAKAHTRARANFERNGVDPSAHEFLVGDAMATLDRLASRGYRYDCVILDPPTFAAGKGRPFSAVRDYAALVSRAIHVLEPEGMLIACSNAQRVTAEELDRALAEGAREAGATLRVVDRCGQPADFPALPALPESSYLKVALAMRV
jgi:23S rRNA (cytosine1962-C5)-methyltransferase